MSDDTQTQATPEADKTPVVPREDEYQRIARKLTKNISSVAAVGNGVMALGGIALAVTAAAPYAAVLGVAAAVACVYRAYASARMVMKVDDVVNVKSDTTEKDIAKKFGLPSFMTKPWAQLGMNSVIAVAGMLLVGTAGFVGSAIAACMVVAGGFGALTSTIALAGQNLLKENFMKKDPVMGDSKPAPDLTPAQDLDAVKPAAEFKAAASGQTAEQTPQEKPVQEIKTPKAGG